MRILIDAHMVGHRESGNERYVRNLVAGLAGLDLPADFVVAASHLDWLPDLLNGRPRWQVATVAASPWTRLGVDLPYLVRHHKVDLLHVTYAAPLWPGCRVVTSVHDVSYRAHPEWFSRRDRCVLTAGVGLTLRAGAEVLTISEHAKRQIEHYYRVPSRRIHVVPLAGDAVFSALAGATDHEVLKTRGIIQPYILAVGNLQPRKNLLRLIGAVAAMKRRGAISPFQLVVAGKAKWNESALFDEVRARGLERDVRFLGYVPDDELAVLYRHASVFAYPSLYEGFGLPVLEAMACGAPVVTSGCTSIPEVSGGAALLVDPCDAEALALALERVMGDPDLQARMKADGYCQAARFAWHKTALATWKVYQQIGGGA